MPTAATAQQPNARQVLAQAQARTRLLENDLKNNAQAQDECRAAIFDARERLEAAAAEAQTGASCLDGIKAALEATRGAREKLLAAEAEVEALRALHTRLEAQSHTLEGDLGWARGGVQRALEGVIAVHPAVAALIEKYQRTRQDLYAIAETIRFVSSRASLPEHLRRWYAEPVAQRYSPEARFVRWLDALAKDASAEIEPDSCARSGE